jgi:hypothetical protein
MASKAGQNRQNRSRLGLEVNLEDCHLLQYGRSKHRRHYCGDDVRNVGMLRAATVGFALDWPLTHLPLHRSHVRQRFWPAFNILVVSSKNDRLRTIDRHSTGQLAG